jgi:opacity protein-like surface antigen
MHGERMKKKILLTAIIVNSLTSNAFGDSLDSFFNVDHIPLVVTVSGGVAFVNAGATQTIDLAPMTIKTFAAHKASNTIGEGEVFVGLQKVLMPQLLGQYVIALTKTSDANLQGYIWDDADSSFNNSTYQYHVQSTRVAFKGKLLFDKIRWLEPWISGSLGVGFNRSHGFSSTPVIPEAVPMNNFNGHIATSFSYTLGAGFQAPINSNWQIGIGYEFADWGQSGLNRSPGQTENSGPELNHIYTQGILVNLTYLK